MRRDHRKAIGEDVKTLQFGWPIGMPLARKMSEHGLSKSEIARRMETSRSALDRLLDPDNVSVTLQTLQSAVQALGGRLSVEIEFDDKAKVA